jgi:hypothetical protein
MNIEIRDAALQARIQKQLQATGSGSVEEMLLRLLETQEEQDRWLLENRSAINAKIRRGMDQLDRGEGIPEDQLDDYLAKLKTKPESNRATFSPRKQRTTLSKSGDTFGNKAVLQWQTGWKLSSAKGSPFLQETPAQDTGVRTSPTRRRSSSRFTPI